MHKGDFGAAGADFGRLVNQAGRCRFDELELLLDIVDCKTNVVQSLPALRQEFANWRVRRKRLQQLDVRVAGIEFRHAHTLLFNSFYGKTFQAQSSFPEGKRFVKAIDGNSDVIDLLQLDLPDAVPMDRSPTTSRKTCARP